MAALAITGQPANVRNFSGPRLPANPSRYPAPILGLGSSRRRAVMAAAAALLLAACGGSHSRAGTSAARSDSPGPTTTRRRSDRPARPIAVAYRALFQLPAP